MSSLCALKSEKSPPPVSSLSTGVDQLCEGLRKRIGWWRGGFTAMADTMELYLSFLQLSSKVDSDMMGHILTLKSASCDCHVIVV